MRAFRKPVPGLLPAAVLLLAVLAYAGNDVPFVPTPEVVVDAMLSIGGVTAQDNLVDLGSGDGRIAITAARKLRARSLGVEFNPDLVKESRENAAREGVSDRVTIRQGDLFETEIRNASVVTMYLLPEVNLRLRPRILSELRPGTRVVSHDFDMGGWAPDDRRRIETLDRPFSRFSMVYLWIVPARVAGRWEGTLLGPEGQESVTIDIIQRYQHAVAIGEVGGDSILGGWFTGSGRIRGERFSLVLDRPSSKSWESPLQLDLLVLGDSMEGEAREGQKRFVLTAGRSREQLRAAAK